MSVRLQRLDGVESVKVSLNDGAAYLRLKPENRVRLAQVRDFVEQGGFSPREARVVARGSVARAADRLRLTVIGADETYDLILDDAPRRKELAGLDGQTVIVEGIVPPVRDEKGRRREPAIRVEGFKVEGQGGRTAPRDQDYRP